jgi:integrase
MPCGWKAPRRAGLFGTCWSNISIICRWQTRKDGEPWRVKDDWTEDWYNERTRPVRPIWGVRLWHDGKERRFGGFTSKTQARDFYEKAKQEQKADRFFPERYQSGGYELVQDAIDRYLQRTTTKKDQRGNRCFARWWGERFTGQRLNAIGTEALEAARQDLLTKGCSPQRVNRYMEWIRHMLNILVRDGKLLSNPAAKLTMFKEPSGTIRFLSENEEAKLTEVLGPIYARWVRFAILTGLRRAEQFALRWSDVDLEGGLLTLPKTKGGGVQYVHLTAEAQALLRQVCKQSGDWKRRAPF